MSMFFFFLNGNIQKTKPKPFKTIYRKGGIKRNPTKHHLNKHLRPHRRSQKETTPKETEKTEHQKAESQAQATPARNKEQEEKSWKPHREGRGESMPMWQVT
uniref:Uncharacterized protein n=1 Tax=Medicago truncatula TaxID=3880 RepID=A4PU40_MEDTR|nr:hypothetical protein MtrDRAFT_AC144563g21v2 [Medicago truncatula]